jgi:hypothetical protein|tara:strand:- start:784 stop:990 length:207 start_codon:yes stop_codon:yes gene_type:complete
MSVEWVSSKFFKEVKQKKEDITDTMLAGVKDFDQYQYLRGRYSSLVDAENTYRELLGKIMQDEESNSS